VTYVRNITDIDDKIIKRALERGISIRALTDEMIAGHAPGHRPLGIEAPDAGAARHRVRAADAGLIGNWKSKAGLPGVERGCELCGAQFPGYGKLSGKSLDELRAGERVAVLDGKDDPLDFVLWKSAKESEPEDAKWTVPRRLALTTARAARAGISNARP
jgi:cysteinyl-tRNA synthetase